jgi:hypothetical protein
MARESTAFAGSGISILREGLAPNSKGAVPGIRGTNTIVSNYEDVNSKLGIIQASGLSVGTTPIHLTAPENRLRGRRQIAIYNLGIQPVYIGGDDSVTTSTGFPIGPALPYTIDVLDHGDIFIVASTTTDVRVVEIK